MFEDLLKLGMTPRKSKIIKLLKMQGKYFKHFLRGYFDGDGHVSSFTYQKKGRKNSSTIISSGFTSGSGNILKEIKKELAESAGISGGTLCYYSQAYRLSLSIHDSFKLYEFMYNNLENTLFLSRKKKVFEKYFKV